MLEERDRAEMEVVDTDGHRVLNEETTLFGGRAPRRRSQTDAKSGKRDSYQHRRSTPQSDPRPRTPESATATCILQSL